MCTSYVIKQRNSGRFGLSTETRVRIDDFYDRLIVPYTAVPVANGDSQEFIPMRYSLVPNWSKEAKVKFATHRFY